MIKLEVIEDFTLKDFHKLDNIKRIRLDQKGKLFVGDTFECDEEMAKYLLGDNPLHRPVVNISEIKPEKKVEEESKINEIVSKTATKEAKSKKKKTSKK